jgi:hypothetical protein
MDDVLRGRSRYARLLSMARLTLDPLVALFAAASHGATDDGA